MDFSAIISAAAIIVVAVIEALAARGRKTARDDKQISEKRAEDRAKESRLGMKMMDASLGLGVATALAVEQCKINGEMKAAKEKVSAAQAEYQDFLQEVAARQISKV